MTIIEMSDDEYREEVRRQVDALMEAVRKLADRDGMINVAALLDATAIMVAWHVDEMPEDEQDAALAALGDAIADALCPDDVLTTNADGDTIQ